MIEAVFTIFIVAAFLLVIIIVVALASSAQGKQDEARERVVQHLMATHLIEVDMIRFDKAAVQAELAERMKQLQDEDVRPLMVYPFLFDFTGRSRVDGRTHTGRARLEGDEVSVTWKGEAPTVQALGARPDEALDTDAPEGPSW